VGSLLILSTAPTPIAAIATSRGTGSANLLTRSPKEVWVDDAVGSPATIDIDLGTVTAIDTIYLGSVSPPAALASWTITGGAGSYNDQVIKAASALRAIDTASRSPQLTHAFWTGAVVYVRYLRLSLLQPNGYGVLSIGAVMAGRSWRPQFNMEFGSGRRVIDTGTVAALPDGGFGTIEGVRKREFNWTLGDLSRDEADALEELLLDHGETIPLLVIEDPDATTGQRARIHYGLFVGLKAYERKNAVQTTWQFTFEDWV
jgi:hypothetical protein